MFATLAMGGSDTSHKNVDASRSKILNLYYTNRVSYPPAGFVQGWVANHGIRPYYSSAAR